MYDRLARMGFYNLNPEEIRDLQPSDAGDLLLRDGRNLAAVLDHLPDKDKRRVVEFLSKLVPGVTDVNVKHVGKKETLEFRQTVGSNGEPWRFMAENMSDGTLRALGILTALFQSGAPSQRKAPVVGIEEPESALHPARPACCDALRAARHQIVIYNTARICWTIRLYRWYHCRGNAEWRNHHRAVDAAGRSAIQVTCCG